MSLNQIVQETVKHLPDVWEWCKENPGEAYNNLPEWGQIARSHLGSGSEIDLEQRYAKLAKLSHSKLDSNDQRDWEKAVELANTGLSEIFTGNHVVDGRRPTVLWMLLSKGYALLFLGELEEVEAVIGSIGETLKEAESRGWDMEIDPLASMKIWNTSLWTMLQGTKEVIEESQDEQEEILSDEIDVPDMQNLAIGSEAETPPSTPPLSKVVVSPSNSDRTYVSDGDGQMAKWK